MKSCSRKILLSMILALIWVVSCFCLTACSFGNSSKLSNESGFVVEGGGFEEGSVLEARLIDSESEDFTLALSAIEGQSYDADNPVYVFEISVKKDGVKVQPNGKVKVSVPVSEDLTGYDVLHVKDDGSIERLSVTYKNDKATFEVDGFSKFVFVKKVTPIIDSGDDNGKVDDGKDNTGGDSGKVDDGKDNTGGNSGNNTAKKYTFYSRADTYVPDSKSGGTVRDANGENITYQEITLDEGTEYTVYSNRYTDYYFLGWYDATESDEGEDATEETLLSTETAYTFTVTKDIKVLALYIYKTHPVKFTLEADGYRGFTYKDGKPALTLVSSSEEGDKPLHKSVVVNALLGDGTWAEYGRYSSYSNFKMKIVDSNGNSIDDIENFDYSTVGKYTITYYYKRNPNINASLEVEVVDGSYKLYVSTYGDGRFFFSFNGNNSQQQTPLKKFFPKGRLITLTARPADNYAFVGWYKEGNVLVSKDLVYCFEMPDEEVNLYGKYEYSKKYLEFSVPYGAGELLDSYGNDYIGNEKIYFTDSLNTNLTVRESDNYVFLGWYDKANGNLLTDSKKLNVKLDKDSANMSVEAKFREKLKYIEIDPETLSDENFTNGTVGFAIGDEAIEYKDFTVKAKGAAGSYDPLSSEDYTIDGSVDFDKAGTYTVTYTYKYDEKIKTQIKIEVIDPSNAQFEFAKGYSYLDHKYDGKATFISLQDVKVNGIPLYLFKSDSKIWDKITYRWIDTETNKEVDTKNVDVTINGTTVKDFGPKNEKRTVGNEFCGPIKAGSYRFELLYDGKTVITQNSTISTQVYKKITSDGEFVTHNDVSMWVGYELYYYTIIGYANGKYYAMQMPSIGNNNGEVEAREISVDANGNATVGGGNDFAFVYAKYYVYSNDDYMEFLTGYYGSYVVLSSSSTIDETDWGLPLIYRTGYTDISDGKISREYGNKTENYGMNVTFDENGAVTIRSVTSTDENGKLRLVYDEKTDKYVFTTNPDDTRNSYDIFLYKTILKTDTQNSDK